METLMSTDLVLHGAEVDLSGLTLDDLAETVRQEHRETERAVSQVVLHAIRCGQALLAARPQIEYGEWRDWLEGVDISQAAASKYMRIAYYKDSLPRDVRTIADAWESVVGRPAVKRSGRPPTPPAMIEDAQKMRADGLTYDAIAERVGAHTMSVYYWLNPDKYAESTRRNEERRRQREQERKALRREEQAKAVKKFGDKKIDEGYSLIRRALNVLDQAQSDTDDREIAGGLREAIAHLQKADAEVLRTLGIK
jgi:hypothetical protein